MWWWKRNGFFCGLLCTMALTIVVLGMGAAIKGAYHDAELVKSETYQKFIAENDKLRQLDQLCKFNMDNGVFVHRDNDTDYHKSEKSTQDINCRATRTAYANVMNDTQVEQRAQAAWATAFTDAVTRRIVNIVGNGICQSESCRHAIDHLGVDTAVHFSYFIGSLVVLVICFLIFYWLYTREQQRYRSFEHKILKQRATKRLDDHHHDDIEKDLETSTTIHLNGREQRPIIPTWGYGHSYRLVGGDDGYQEVKKGQ